MGSNYMTWQHQEFVLHDCVIEGDAGVRVSVTTAQGLMTAGGCETNGGSLEL